MNYGLYISASGMCSAMHRMDTAANNLANTETTGFKPDLAASMARQAVRPEDNVWNLPSDKMLEKLGAGVLMAPTATNFAQGALQNSTSDLDVAIDGEGFLTVQSPSGAAPRLTRDGRLAVNGQGQIVQASSGLPVLDQGGYPVRVDAKAPGALVIATDGTIKQGNNVIGNFAIVKPSDPRTLKKAGQNLYALTAGAGTDPAPGKLLQHSLEASGADPVKAMLDISDADRAVTANGKMIQIYDDLMSRTISTFGRIA